MQVLKIVEFNLILVKEYDPNNMIPVVSGAEHGYQLGKIPQNYLWLGQVGRWAIISDQSLVVFNI